MDQWETKINFQISKAYFKWDSKVGLKAKGSEFSILERQTEGIQTTYYENSQVKRLENYKNGEFIDGKCFDETGTEIVFFPIW
jgi:antitoxin component YwqK of YwqJK toxin-antitoxin module